MLNNKLITLITDFGLTDPFVGIIKGVMLNINNNIKFVDISHLIEPQNIMQAAYVLQQSYSYFPKGTIHTVIVDPGVGSKRKMIIAQTKKYYFVSPDNGVLSSIFMLSDFERVLEITEEKYFLENISSTFHGRDIFAPVAAHLSKGDCIDNFGKELSDFKRFNMPLPRSYKDRKIIGEVIYIDRFGNLITNILKKYIPLGKKIVININNLIIDGLKNSYAESDDKPSALINSWGGIEIFLKNKNSSKKLTIEVGSKVEVDII